MNQSMTGGRRLLTIWAAIGLAAVSLSGVALGQSQEPAQDPDTVEAEAQAALEREADLAEAALARRLAELQATDPGAREALREAMALREAALARAMQGRRGSLRAAEGRFARGQEQMEQRRREMASAWQGRVAPRVRARVAPRIAGQAPMPAMGMLRLRGASAGRILAHSEELGLSDDQVARIRAIEKTHRRAEIERGAAIEVGELDLEDLMHDPDNMDIAAVEAEMLEISRLRVAERIADLRMNQEMRAVLTAEQRDQLEDLGPRMFFRTRGEGGEGTGGVFEFRGEGPEGRGGAWFFDDDEDGWAFRLGDETLHLEGDLLLEALEPLHELELFFGRDHNTWHEDDGDVEDEGAAEDDEREGDGNENAGASASTWGVKTEIGA